MRRFWLGLLAALCLVLAALGGNTLARHAGAPGAPPLAVVQSGPEGQHEPAAPADHGQRLLHLVGACLAALGAVGLLLLAARAAVSPDVGEPSRSLRAGRCHGRHVWRPPALAPPTLSPVLRT